MEFLYIIIPLIIVLFVVNKIQGKGINNINTAQLKEMIAGKSKEYYYVDVRTPGEFSTKKIKGFKNIPLNDLANRMDQIPKDKKIVVICQSGARSTAASRQLKKAGYNDIFNVTGGMNLWRG